jgi:hypothetical protein
MFIPQQPKPLALRLYLVSWQWGLVADVACVQWLFAECDLNDADPPLLLHYVQPFLLGLPHINDGDGADLSDLVDVSHTTLDDLSCTGSVGKKTVSESVSMLCSSGTDWDTNSGTRQVG